MKDIITFVPKEPLSEGTIAKLKLAEEKRKLYLEKMVREFNEGKYKDIIDSL